MTTCTLPLFSDLPEIPQGVLNYNSVQLLTYPSSLGGSLQTLNECLEMYFKGAVTSLHLLPCYLSSGDRGFAPISHTTVAPEFGSERDLENLCERYLVSSDLIIGHVSTSSPSFLDFLKNGEKSSFSEMFLTAEKVFAEGQLSLEELTRFAHYLPTLPLRRITLSDGSSRLLFCSYTDEQVDLDIYAPETRSYLKTCLCWLKERGIQMVRVDAFETCVKDAKAGYDNQERKIEVLSWLAREIHETGLAAVAEVYASEDLRAQIHEHSVHTYDFNAGELILHAMHFQTPYHLLEWMRQDSEPPQISYLSNHDALVIGLNSSPLPARERTELRNRILSRVGSLARTASSAGWKNICAQGINATFLEAVGGDMQKRLFAHALLLAAPRIPQIYYNDLLCAEGDVPQFIALQDGRALVRHNFSKGEIAEKLQRSEIQQATNLMRIRCSHPAFSQGSPTISAPSATTLEVHWGRNHT